MTIKELQQLLFEYEDKKYGDFSAKLIPGLPRNYFIGIRAPEYKNILKRIKNDSVIPLFLSSLPHTYHEENCLHVQLINKIKDFDECLAELEKFIP
ncbi:MAG: DNA alkylation repair protein, partial [Treponema sp.]|nr:DNA alkylation repair protein [Treponema sp.]